jgi:hypothetical protein
MTKNYLQSVFGAAGCRHHPILQSWRFSDQFERQGSRPDCIRL